MSIALRAYTYADLAEMPDDGNRYEIVGGELIVSPASPTNHQRVVVRLSALLSKYVWDHQLGEPLLGPIDVVLSPYNVVQPDLMFVSAARSDIVGVDAVNGPPDLTVEILSRRSRGIDLVRKKAMYATAGVREYWVADPDHRTLLVYSLVDGEYDEVATGDGIVRSIAVPGFELALADVFAGLQPEPED